MVEHFLKPEKVGLSLFVKVGLLFVVCFLYVLWGKIHLNLESLNIAKGFPQSPLPNFPCKAWVRPDLDRYRLLLLQNGDQRSSRDGLEPSSAYRIFLASSLLQNNQCECWISYVRIALPLLFSLKIFRFSLLPLLPIRHFCPPCLEHASIDWKFDWIKYWYDGYR